MLHTLVVNYLLNEYNVETYFPIYCCAAESTEPMVLKLPERALRTPVPAAAENPAPKAEQKNGDFTVTL